MRGKRKSRRETTGGEWNSAGHGERTKAISVGSGMGFPYTKSCLSPCLALHCL